MVEGEDKLIRAAKTGDQGSFDQLYCHYVPPIYRFIYMKVAHREEAEDLTHEVFLLAWQNLHRYQARGFPFSSWLYQIARNKVIDHYRLRKPNVNIEEVDADLIKVESTVEAAVDRGLSMARVREALQELTPDQQDVLLMKFMEDLSHQEIAAALEKSEGAVRLIQHRGLQELKRILGSAE